MIETLYKTVLLFIILIYLIWRFLYSPRFTDFARQRYIVESLTKRSFEELKRGRSERIKVRGRTGYAHWKSYEHENGIGMIVEFDVHPSAFPISVSASEFIRIQSHDHLEQMKRDLQQSDDYSPFLASDAEIQKIKQ